MMTEASGQLVTVYVNSTDQWHGRALYTAIVHLCQELGIAGATVSRCMEGYGAHRHLHTTRLLELAANLPVRIEIIDLAERIEPLLPVLGTMIGEGLVTVQVVHTLKFVTGPRPDRGA